MAILRAEVSIDAPAAAVWEVVAHQFDRVGEWATAIPSSTPAHTVTQGTGVPVAGRICRTGMALVPEVTERIVAYDEARRTLTYQGEGLPRVLGIPRNQWRVETVVDRRTRVSLEATLPVRGVVGRLMYLLLRRRLARAGAQLLDDLKHYVEQGHPSPDKQRQLRQSHR